MVDGVLRISQAGPAAPVTGSDKLPLARVNNTAALAATVDDIANYILTNTPLGEAPVTGSTYGRRSGVWDTVLPLSGGYLQGDLFLLRDPYLPLGAATMQYVDNLVSRSGGPWLPLSGGAVSGTITLPGNAVGVLDAVPLQQLTAATAGGPFLPLTGGTVSGRVNLFATDWFRPFASWVSDSSHLYALHPTGSIGITGAAQTVDGEIVGTPVSSIGVAGFAMNNRTGPGLSAAWGGYFEARQYPGASSWTMGIEIDVANVSGTDATRSTPYGQTNPFSVGLNLASGAGVSAYGLTAKTASVALAILDNQARFQTGIMFRSTALVGTNGTGDGSIGYAISLATNHAISWTRPDNTPGPLITSNQTTGTAPQLHFENGSLHLSAGTLNLDSGGVSFGLAGASATDLSKHIDLYGGSYGFNTYGGSVNYNSVTDHHFLVGGVISNVLNAGGISTVGLTFGSNVAASITDLTKHIQLYSPIYGINVTGGFINYVVPTSAVHQFVVNGLVVGSIGANGIMTGPAGGPTWTTGSGVPSSTQPVGSLYSRVSTWAAGATLYVSKGAGAWTAVASV